MTPERWRQIEELYHAVRERGAAVLADTDPELRKEVESLLAQRVSQDGMLDRPAFAVAPSILETVLTPGTQLGPYVLEAPVGKGGMGEVYRARDPRLNRDVAIKVSGARFSERFEREAKAIAALNHSNICQVYDVGPNYLVMELIEGESPEGPLPVEQVERIALQIADALDAAHEKGITHRDLKPGNIKIKPDGTVKVLDFGLAKVTAAPAGPGETSPTLTMGMTEAGVILGTAAYMSPEQARGQKVDKRSDIWAFGVVVWELLTGERMFQGDSTVQVLGKVLDQQIDLARVPHKFQRLLARCLERDVKNRLRDIGEARFLLEAPPASQPLQRRGWLWPVLMAVAILAALGASYVAYRDSTGEPPVTGRFSILIPENLTFDNPAALPAISPDGRHVALVLIEGQKRSLWVRDLDGSSARLLADTEGASYPFWSPDGRSLAFFVNRKLQRIDVAGGPVRTIAEQVPGGPRGGTWNQDGAIVFGTSTPDTGLFRVAAEGGAVVALSSVAPDENNHRAPWFLPDGKRFLYTARSRSQDATKTRVYVESIDAQPGGHTRREVLAADSNAVYVPVERPGVGISGKGYLLFLRDRTLMAQPFNPGNAQTAGEAVPIADAVDFFPAFSQGQFSASRNGTLVYISGARGVQRSQLTWFDRGGRPAGNVGKSADILGPRISPDGSIVATDPTDNSGARDVWLHDLTRGTSSRFTFGPGWLELPVWSPEGKRIVYVPTTRGGVPRVKPADGIGADEPLATGFRGSVTDWSRDGRFVMVNTGPQGSPDIWVFPQFGDRKPFPYINSEFREGNGRLSPDGRWLAYVSDESKRLEVYVQTFPERGGKWQISTSGGDWPVWSRDGRELYFITPDRKLMAVEIGGGGESLQAGVPKALFEIPVAPGQTSFGGFLGTGAPYDVGKDGRFLVQVPVKQETSSIPLSVITNWQAGLKK